MEELVDFYLQNILKNADVESRIRLDSYMLAHHITNYSITDDCLTLNDKTYKINKSEAEDAFTIRKCLVLTTFPNFVLFKYHGQFTITKTEACTITLMISAWENSITSHGQLSFYILYKLFPKYFCEHNLECLITDFLGIDIHDKFMNLLNSMYTSKFSTAQLVKTFGVAYKNELDFQTKVINTGTTDSINTIPDWDFIYDNILDQIKNHKVTRPLPKSLLNSIILALCRITPQTSNSKMYQALIAIANYFKK